jgi:hypothetical protein
MELPGWIPLFTYTLTNQRVALFLRQGQGRPHKNGHRTMSGRLSGAYKSPDLRDNRHAGVLREAGVPDHGYCREAGLRTPFC